MIKEKETVSPYNSINVKIRYISKEIAHLTKITIGDWIDLRSAEDVELKKGEFRMIRLGVAMKLPNGFEAIMAPRSSTCKNFKIIQANGIGIMDNSYCGNNDEWRMPVIAVEDTIIHKDDRICQFRIQKNQPIIEFEEVDDLGTVDRGGFGSTGKKVIKKENKIMIKGMEFPIHENKLLNDLNDLYDPKRTDEQAIKILTHKQVGLSLPIINSSDEYDKENNISTITVKKLIEMLSTLDPNTKIKVPSED